MDYIVSGKESGRADKYTINDIGIPSLVLMERASLAVANLIEDNEYKSSKMVAVCGIGNNGADGVAVARILLNKGYKVDVYVLGNIEKATEEFKEQVSIAKKLGVKFTESIDNYDVYIDGIFGVGLSRNVEGVYKEIIEKINSYKKTVYAVDIPSGISADTGKIMGIAIKANYTVTFGKAKVGNIMYPGADNCGKLIISDIGISDIAYNDYYTYLEKEDLELLPKRANYSNKGTFGKVLIIAGSEDISGAALLSSRAVFSTGAGMVKVMTHDNNASLIKEMLPEAMISSYNEKPDLDKLDADIPWCDVILAGPGMGISDNAKSILEKVLNSDKKIVLDADALNNIAEDENLKNSLNENVIITPHLMEMSRVLNKDISSIKDDIINTAINARSLGSLVVLKDARTVTYTDKVYINTTGNNGMATAGSGDVLAGIIAGLLAIGLSHELAPPMGVFIHGLAGDMAAKRKSKSSLLAGDIIDELSNIFE